MQFRPRCNWCRRLNWWINDYLPRWPEGYLAWWPVKLDTGRYAWLERVDRETTNHFYSYDNMFGGKSHDYYTTTTYRSRR